MSQPTDRLWGARFKTGPSEALAALSVALSAISGLPRTTSPVPGHMPVSCNAPGC